MSATGRLLPALQGLGAVAGLGVAAYLTLVHFNGIPLACSSTGTVDCERVLTSPFAVVAGTGAPTAAAGLAWFGIAVGLAAAQLARPRSRPAAALELGWAAAGLLVVMLLVYLEIVQLGAICAWCTAAHALVLATFLLALVRWQALSGIHTCTTEAPTV